MSALGAAADMLWPWPRRGAATPDAEQESAASLKSLRTLLALCVLVPLLLYVAFAAYRFAQVHDEAELRLDRALRIANEHGLKVLETNEAMLGHILDLTAANPPEPQLHAQLAALARDKPQVQSIWVMDAEGRTVATSRMSPAPDIVITDLDFFQWHRSHASTLSYFSQSDIGRVTREPYFSMSRGRFGPDGSFAGVVAIALNPEYFTRFHADLSANEPGLAITMFREDGIVYSRWPPLATAPKRMAPSSPVLSRVLAGERHGVVRGTSSLDRNARLLTFRQVGEYPVYLGTGLALAAIRTGWLREIALIGAFCAVPVLGLVIAALAAMKRARQSIEASRRLRVEAEARLQVEEALRQAQKMEALGRLTGGVAHDFNNALMVISANLQVLKLTHPQLTGRQTDAIGRAVDTAANLTRQLLAFSRRQPLLPQVVQLAEKLPEMKDLLAPVLGSQVALSIRVAEGTAPIRVDLAELELALINLAVNAKDAMPQGGTFRIDVRNAPAPHPLQGEAVFIEASDDGAGIPPDLLARVFEPFFTTKPVGEGTGLGLSQIYGLCQRSGGTALLRSTVGQGTTVTLVFPPAECPVEADREGTSSEPQRLDERVLLVEDNPEVAAAIRPVLEMLGCRVTHFGAAQPALDWLAQNAAEVDLVLTDVVMPGALDGLALAQQVRRRHPQLRLLVMTGYAAQMEEITRQGFPLLAKPWTASNLARAIRAQAL